MLNLCTSEEQALFDQAVKAHNLAFDPDFHDTAFDVSQQATTQRVLDLENYVQALLALTNGRFSYDDVMDAVGDAADAAFTEQVIKETTDCIDDDEVMDSGQSGKEFKDEFSAGFREHFGRH